MVDAGFQLAGKSVYVAGHRGMVGAALVRRLEAEECRTVVADRTEVDLLDMAAVRRFLAREEPEVVIVAAAKVGGIHANSTYRADFIYQNLAIATNLIHASHEMGAEKLLFLGSSCIYPKLAAQPMSEDALLTGPLEPTNEPYAIAKIAGIKMCESYRRQYKSDFISVMPTNLYGPGDNYHAENSHVAAALIRRFHQAKVDGATSVVVWGSGTPKREFLFVEDLADACIHLLKHYSDEGLVNIGTGTDVTIGEFAAIVAKVVGYDGAIEFDATKPDGTPRKLLDVSRLAALGWTARTGLEAGLAQAYGAFLSGPQSSR